MSSEARLYTFSPETKNALRRFRLGTSRAKDPQAVIYQIDKSTMEIKQVDETIYSNMQDLSDELPDNSPRYVLLSYPLTMTHKKDHRQAKQENQSLLTPSTPLFNVQQESGRLSVPYVMINYLPPTCSSEMRMLYAGAKELMRNQAEVNRIIEMDAAEEIEEIEEKLKGED
ncbi:hypothetical protein KC343_g13246 [Hortaea werneckii]|nr:hypothetical protein KC352_g25107 [Hortaea werneckii]KAI7557307.1 hypothetical protein KC317_g11712 [Hortaea werneckii]KAI7605590.1 hypothetical protein KC346_g10951 [Hortaea werneckii]KAI7606952.1 hypothetical protein KC343_g13246 [Hortaea werneckii]KAI7648410.1 hypothetical protein KC319_g11426 [Hortaea werneckii]